ncbi:hypothetical protein [Streptomyces sp. NPDC016626]|uniref:hypothetical protein n=1 Tax=Streptomyces sp. NPDC016626 TaxID=3364968 RepID=UPI003702FCF3
MSDTEQGYGARRTYQHQQAQVQAYDWATRATAEYNQAVQHEDDARERQQYDSGWQRDRAAESRTLAQLHGVRSTEALKLAEMWARVARALADAPRPSEVLVTDATLTEQAAAQLRTQLANRAVRTPDGRA